VADAPQAPASGEGEQLFNLAAIPCELASDQAIEFSLLLWLSQKSARKLGALRSDYKVTGRTAMDQMHPSFPDFQLERVGDCFPRHDLKVLGFDREDVTAVLSD
jgi:hypothetical protein